MSDTTLVVMKDQEAVTSSLMVADAFGKQHKHVIEAIETKIHSAENSAQYSKMFVMGTYKDSSGKANKLFYMNRDGFTFIAMGFTGRKADEFKLKYIQAFNSMERMIAQMPKPQFQIPKTLGDALQLAADQTKKLEKQKPKVDYYDAQMRNPGLLTTTIIAKEYGKSAIWLNKYLVKRGVLYRQGKNLVLKKKYDDESYASYENWSDDEHKHVHPLLKWTQRGKKFIYDLLAADGILPNVETMLTE